MYIKAGGRIPTGLSNLAIPTELKTFEWRSYEWNYVCPEKGVPGFLSVLIKNVFVSID